MRYFTSPSAAIGVVDEWELINNKIIARQKDWHDEDSKPWSLADWSNAMFGEFGEAANKIKKLKRLQTAVKGNHSYEDENYLKKEIEKELADGYQYLVLLAHYAEVDLKEGVKTTFNEKSKEIGSYIKI